MHQRGDSLKYSRYFCHTLYSMVFIKKSNGFLRWITCKTVNFKYQAGMSLPNCGDLVDLFVNGISTFVDYLMLKPFL